MSTKTALLRAGTVAGISVLAALLLSTANGEGGLGGASSFNPSVGQPCRPTSCTTSPADHDSQIAWSPDNSSLEVGGTVSGGLPGSTRDDDDAKALRRGADWACAIAAEVLTHAVYSTSVVVRINGVERHECGMLIANVELLSPMRSVRVKKLQCRFLMEGTMFVGGSGQLVKFGSDVVVFESFVESGEICLECGRWQSHAVPLPLRAQGLVDGYGKYADGMNGAYFLLCNAPEARAGNTRTESAISFVGYGQIGLSKSVCRPKLAGESRP